MSSSPNAPQNPSLLVESEGNYRTLLEAIDIGFCVIQVLFNDQGRAYDYIFLEANPAFAKHAGLSDVVGKTMREQEPNLDEFWFRTYGHVALTGEPVSLKSQKGAAERWLDLHAMRVGAPEEHKVAVLFTDITARKEAQEALKESEEELLDAKKRLESALLAGNIATWAFDIVNDRVVADDNLAHLFSVDPEAARGGRLSAYLENIFEDDRARVTAEIGEAIASQPQFESEYRVVLPDGSHRWLVARGKVERDKSGRAVSLPGVVLDITERVHREQRERFLFELAERARTLTTPEAVIEDAVRSVGEFLQASRCAFAEVDLETDTCTIPVDYRSDDSLPSIAGVLPVSAFGPYLIAEFLQGHAVAVEDIRMASDIVTPEYITAYEAIGARAFVSVPAMYSSRLITLISLQQVTPRQWTPEEISLLRTVVERTWLTVEVTRQQRLLQETAQRERSLLSNIFMQAPAFMAVLRGPQHTYEIANLPYYQLIGKQDAFAHQEIIGKTVAEVIPEMGDQGFVGLLDHVYQTGETFVGTDTSLSFQVDAEGPMEEHFIDFTFQPMYDENRAVSGILVHGVDLTARKRLEQERERLLAETRAIAERESLLNQIGAEVRGKLEPEAILQAVVTTLGNGLQVDRCYFVQYDQTHDTAKVSPEWRRADTLQLLSGRTFQTSRYSVDRDTAYMSGKPHIVNDVVAFNPEDAEPLLSLDIRSLMRVPIAVGTQMSALAVAMAHEPRNWTDDEIRLVENVGSLVRSTLESVQAQQRERNIAQQLQAALLPPDPEDLPGLRLASFYRPALSEAGVGGDFFDVFSVEKSCTALVVADLSGKGLTAASQVATVRNMLRFALYNGSTVAEAITRLHNTLVEHDLLIGFATLFVGMYDHALRTITYVNCGQEPGLVRRAATGLVELLPPTGSVLGGFGPGNYTEETVRLMDGDIIALFTDGLTEVGPDRKHLLGVEGVRGLLHQCCTGTPQIQAPQTLVERLIAGIDGYGVGGSRDDIALLVGLSSPITAR